MAGRRAARRGLHRQGGRGDPLSRRRVRSPRSWWRPDQTVQVGSVLARDRGEGERRRSDAGQPAARARQAPPARRRRATGDGRAGRCDLPRDGRLRGRGHHPRVAGAGRRHGRRGRPARGDLHRQGRCRGALAGGRHDRRGARRRPTRRCRWAPCSAGSPLGDAPAAAAPCPPRPSRPRSARAPTPRPAADALPPATAPTARPRSPPAWPQSHGIDLSAVCRQRAPRADHQGRRAGRRRRQRRRRQGAARSRAAGAGESTPDPRPRGHPRALHGGEPLDPHRHQLPHAARSTPSPRAAPR